VCFYNEDTILLEFGQGWPVSPVREAGSRQHTQSGALAALAFELDGGPVHQRFAPRSGLQGRHELLTYFEIRKENKSNFKASSYEVGKVSLGIKSFVEKLRGHFGRAK